jgi:hypothetical protein
LVFCLGNTSLSGTCYTWTSEARNRGLFGKPRVFDEPLASTCSASRQIRLLYFSNALCHAVANALKEGSLVTDITFESSCSFPDMMEGQL